MRFPSLSYLSLLPILPLTLAAPTGPPSSDLSIAPGSPATNKPSSDKAQVLSIIPIVAPADSTYAPVSGLLSDTEPPTTEPPVTNSPATDAPVTNLPVSGEHPAPDPPTNYRLVPVSGTVPAYFALAGDSTTASQSEGAGGWGDGFLKTTLRNGAEGTNYGHNGASSASFRELGDWDRLLADVRQKRAEGRPVWVTIQFGHNDQKPGSHVTIEQYKANLKQFAQDVENAGGIPIHVTPLSRRNFFSGEVKEDLAAQRSATLEVAQEDGFLALDLNLASTKYLDAIGPNDAQKFNLAANDYTHLNLPSSTVFGNMVSELMVDSDQGSELGKWTQPVGEIKTAIDLGKFYFP